MLSGTIVAYYDRMKHQEGWAPARLLPLLAGLDQLVPWLLQWHNDIAPDLQLRLGEFYRDFSQVSDDQVCELLEASS